MAACGLLLQGEVCVLRRSRGNSRMELPLLAAAQPTRLGGKSQTQDWGLGGSCVAVPVYQGVVGTTMTNSCLGGMVGVSETGHLTPSRSIRN